MLVSLRHIHAVEPSLFSRSIIAEEQYIGPNVCVRCENIVGHTDDSVKIEFCHQFPLDACLYIGAEKETVRQNHRRATILFETIHYEDHEKISGFTAAQI